jgi:hypothetical protein
VSTTATNMSAVATAPGQGMSNMPPSSNVADANTGIPKAGTSNVGSPTSDKMSSTDKMSPAEAKVIEKLIIDGKEIEVDKDTMKRWAQQYGYATKMHAEASQMRKAAEAKFSDFEKRESKLKELESKYGDDALKYIMERHQSDPEKMKALRVSMEKALYSEIERDQASPEAKARMAAEARAEKAEKELSSRQEKEKQAAFQQRVAAHREQIQTVIVKGLDASGLPHTEWNVKHMANLMQQAEKAGYTLSPEQLAYHLKQDRIEHIQSLGSEYSKQAVELSKAGDNQKLLALGQQITDLYGEDILKALRLYDLAKLRSGQPNLPRPIVDAPKAQVEEKKTKPYMTEDEWAKDPPNGDTTQSRLSTSGRLAS